MEESSILFFNSSANRVTSFRIRQRLSQPRAKGFRVASSRFEKTYAQIKIIHPLFDFELATDFLAGGTWLNWGFRWGE